MTIVTTHTFDKLFRKLNKRVQRRAAERAELFKSNPFNPVLRTERLRPKKFNVWSFRIDRSYRIVFRFLESDQVEFMFIGHHNKIYNYDIFK